MAPDTGHHVTAIYNACYLVRHYARGGRSTLQREQRTEAIRRLALALREALEKSNDPEPILAAVVDGLRPRNEPPF